MDTTSSLPLSEKQKEQLAQARILQRVGMMAFAKLPLPEREALRKKERLLIDSELSASFSGAKLHVQDIAGVKVQQTSSKTHTQQASSDSIPSKSALQENTTQNQARINPLEITISPHEQIQPSSEFQAFAEKAEALAPSPHARNEKPFEARNVSAGNQQGNAGKKKHESFALSIVLNAKQTLAAEYAEAGKSFCLTGAAGTGKTTACREIAKRLLVAGKLGEHDFKVKGGDRVMAPSIAFCAYTNRATDNMRRALHKDEELERELMYNVLTIHKLLEYEPVFYDVIEEKTGDMRTTVRFEPQRTAKNPLRITHLVIEESSMLGTDLGIKLLEALPKGCQIIYVGDINQLPPIFSKSMLNYALILLPVVELDEVYRQALESPIIYNAHKCLRGEDLEDKRPFFQIVDGKQLKIMPTESGVVNKFVNSLKSWNDTIENGSKKYDPEQDIVLSPWNKQECGTQNINNHIAQFLGKKRGALVYEIYAGMRKLYLAVGDRVMIDKQDGVITNIRHNGKYMGKMPRAASTNMTRFGVMLADSNASFEDLELSLSGYAAINVDDIQTDDDKKKQEASHVVEVTLDSGRTEMLATAGDFAESVCSLGYALTVHKAQGCEWRKVFILIHKNHAISLTRELLYTAITRAREYCIIIDLTNQTKRAIETQRIKGNSVEEKIEWFNSELSLAEPVPVVPYLDLPVLPLPDNIVRKPKQLPQPFVSFETKHTPVQLVRLCEFVPDAFKQEALQQLAKRWQDAQRIWGDKIGSMPSIQYDLQREKTIGLANLAENVIKLNPLWCILAQENARIKDEMLGDTLDHEICHLISWNYSKDKGHDSGWRMAMKLMGREPKVYADAGALPSWTHSFKELLEQQKQKLIQANAMLHDDYEVKDSDQL